MKKEQWNRSLDGTFLIHKVDVQRTKPVNIYVCGILGEFVIESGLVDSPVIFMGPMI